MTTLLVDYSMAKPSAATIKAAGYAGAMRYLSTDPSKNLTPAERDALLNAGLSIGLVWETYATRAGAGAAAGAADAKAAEAQAKALGLPAGLPIFYAVDFGANPAAVKPYFLGVKSAAARPVGIYGSISVVDTALTGGWATYGWQTVAWSAGKVSTIAHLYQRLKATVAHPIPGTDENIVLRPFPMWTKAAPVPPKPPVPPAPKPPVPPAPKPPVPPAPKPPVSPYSVATVKAWQSLMRVTADGKWGSGTDTPSANFRAAARGQAFNVKMVQAIIGTKVDGIWGPASKAALKVRTSMAQQILKVGADGVWGPATDAAYTKFRNQFYGKF